MGQYVEAISVEAWVFLHPEWVSLGVRHLAMVILGVRPREALVGEPLCREDSTGISARLLDLLYPSAISSWLQSSLYTGYERDSSHVTSSFAVPCVEFLNHPAGKNEPNSRWFLHNQVDRAVSWINAIPISLRFSSTASGSS
jgi:hypothetical protein